MTEQDYDWIAADRRQPSRVGARSISTYETQPSRKTRLWEVPFRRFFACQRKVADLEYCLFECGMTCSMLPARLSRIFSLFCFI